MQKKAQINIPSSAVGKRLYDYLTENGYHINAACGANGICGKCRVKVLSGVFYKTPDRKEILFPDENNELLSCMAYCSEQAAEILLPIYPETEISDILQENKKKQIDPLDSINMGYSVALDIGTTTLAAALVYTGTSKVIETYSCLNPQQSFGADVMSRISSAAEGKLAIMQEVLLKEVRNILEYFSSEYKINSYDRLAVVGNTTMLHIFCKISPVGIGQYPFTPSFTEMKEFSGSEFSLPVKVLTLLPSASAFIGADVIAGIFKLKLTENQSPSLFIDIGTNGEMALFTGKKRQSRLFTASAAAGPALEGAGISTGIGGIKGAVSSIEPQGTVGFKTKTVGDAPPIGICGSGLIDAISILLEQGKLDEGGYLDDGIFIYAEDEEQNKLSITQADIRAFQLAKSAICAGIEALISEAKLLPRDIEKVYIAGGLGYYMNVRNAAKVGLLPKAFIEISESVGNSALAGAIAFLEMSRSASDSLLEIADLCENVELNFSEVFNTAFIENMMFEA